MFTAEVESILKMRERFKEAVLGKYGTVTKPHLVAISKSIRASSMKVVFWLTISGVIVAAKTQVLSMNQMIVYIVQEFHLHHHR